MSFKKTSFIADHYPNTYMEQFCKALHSDLELGTVCVSWFRQATKHCTDLLNNVQAPSSYFWTTVKNFIFPDRTTELVSQKIPINIHPNRLTLQDCHSLYLDIVNDYVQRAPRYSAESTTNVMLWQILYSLIGIMALGSSLVYIIFAYNKYGQPKQKFNLWEEVFKPEKCLQAIAKRSLRLCKAELRNIHVKPIAKKEDILAADGVEVLAFKIGTKYELLNTVVAGNLHGVGKLHRLYDPYNKTKEDFKIEALNKAMRFLDNNCKKLHLMLTFEEHEDYEEELALKKRKSNSPRIKSLSPPTIPSTRISSINSKRMLNTKRLEGGGASNKLVSTATGFDLATDSSRSNSPKLTRTPRLANSSSKQVTIPRSSGVVSSGIPRNVSKRSPITNKPK